MTKVEIALSNFNQGHSCAQAVLCAFAPDLGLNRDMALKVAAGFGGGLGRSGEVCGAVTGAIIALGLKFGSTKLNDREAKEITYANVRAFCDEFKRRHKTLLCRELLGCDISTNEGLVWARQHKLFITECPHYVKTATEIAARLIAGPEDQCLQPPGEAHLPPAKSHP